MSDEIDKTGVTFVYDGACPVCTIAAEALRIRQELGPLTLLDARTEAHHPLITDINDRGFDLDAGMVIEHSGRFYHGDQALEFMAVYGAPKGTFNHINRLLFRSRFLAKTLYPLMRASRNLLIRARGVAPIQNLRAGTAPIFTPIFGESWPKMPPVMHAHYQNRAYSADRTVVKGLMSVKAAWFMRLAGPFTEWLGLVPVRNGSDIPVTVAFESEPDGTGLWFNRQFCYPGMEPFRFKSRMVPLGGNEIVEELRCRLGWHVAFVWEDAKVKLKHKGFKLCFFGRHLPLPITWLLGTVNAEEWETGPDSFAMRVEIMHPLFGKTYEYRGEFTEVTSA